MIVNIEGNDITVTRVDNDVNGNPRYVVHYLAIGLKEWESTPLTILAGLRKYTANWYGGGFAFASYNVEDSLKRIVKTIKEGQVKC